eukprot:SAG31_NODE_2859_length_4990_cov_113.128399_1_plen_50_part_00
MKLVVACLGRSSARRAGLPPKRPVVRIRQRLGDPKHGATRLRLELLALG